MTPSTKATSVLLWISQTVLAALFLFAGVTKLTMALGPVAQMTGLPVMFLRFIATVEILGAVGLVLPGLLRIQRVLTPLAAIGLVGVMTGATILTATSMGVVPALFPAVVGTLLVAVIRGRRQWARRPVPARAGRRDGAAVAARVTKRAA